MKKKLLSLGFICFVVSSVSISASANKEQDNKNSVITVFNAASTTDLMDEIAIIFLEETGITVNFNPSASGTLARQIEQGANVDVFISASNKWMKYVNDLDLTIKSSSFVRNNLVLISPMDSSIDSFEINTDLDLPAIFTGRISIGDPEFVPAGAYAKEALDFYGWYSQLESRILPGSDVRAALAVVELGESDLGIVYSSDAGKSKKVRIVAQFPVESHTPVEYYCGHLKNSSPEGELFYLFLISNPKAFELYQKYGFEGIE